MKILVCTGIYPPEIGGPATVMAEFVRDARIRRHEVQVVTFGDNVESKDGVVRVSRRGGLVLRTIRAARAIRALLTPDVVLIGTDVSSIGLPLRLALIGRSNRFFLRVGGEWMWEAAVNRGAYVTLREFWSSSARWSSRQGGGLRGIIPAWILRRANQIIITSDILRQPLERIAPSVRARIVTVPNGRAPSAARVSRHSTSEELHVLYAGRFAPVKNVPLFARALKSAIARGARIKATFVGDGRELVTCQEILRGVQGVQFLGKKTPQEIQALLEATDLYVLPSLSDVCPNGVLEALAQGVPCLVTAEHGLPNEVGGLVEISPKDEQAWTDALVRYAGDRDALEVIRRGVRVPEMGRGMVDVVTAD